MLIYFQLDPNICQRSFILNSKRFVQKNVYEIAICTISPTIPYINLKLWAILLLELFGAPNVLFIPIPRACFTGIGIPLCRYRLWWKQPQEPFCACIQPMRIDITLYHRLPLVGRISERIPATVTKSCQMTTSRKPYAYIWWYSICITVNTRWVNCYIVPRLNRYWPNKVNPCAISPSGNITRYIHIYLCMCMCMCMRMRMCMRICMCMCMCMYVCMYCVKRFVSGIQSARDSWLESCIQQRKATCLLSIRYTLATNVMESPTRWLHGFIHRHDFEIIRESWYKSWSRDYFYICRQQISLRKCSINAKCVIKLRAICWKGVELCKQCTAP